MSLYNKKKTSLWLIWILTPLLVLASLIGNPEKTIYAQAQDGDWTPPINLSRSGGTMNPAVVVDNNGTTHVIWADLYSGFMYSRLTEESWTTPKPVIFPFSPPRNVTIGPEYPTPIFMTDQRNRIHAFWIDGRGILNHSSVFYLYMDSTGSWSGRRVIAESAVAMDVDKDANGNIHVAYIRSLSSMFAPAGLYYRWLNTTSYWWSLPTLLDESPYYRTLESSNANVNIISTWVDETVNLTIGWDNRPRNRISMIMSNDNGSTWGEVQVIEGPEISTTPVIPFNLQIGSFGSSTMLVWQEDEPGESCNQLYMFSGDGGETWQNKQRMLTNLQGCAEEYRFIIDDEGQIILMTKILGQVYFQAWDGQRWSDPQLQSILSSFIDQETFNLVDLNCQFTLLTPLRELLVAGCDQGVGGDIWLTSRKLEAIDNWFPAETRWSYPASITMGSSITLSSSMTAGTDGSVHVIWSQKDSPTDDGAMLVYARTDGANWSPPQILFGPPIHYVGNTAIAISNNVLYAAWSDQSTGEIVISSAPADRASNPREWTNPVSVPLPRKDGSSPEITIGQDGTIILAYTISINELRGVYVVISENGGLTWSEPVQVFDAVAAGWPVVNSPKMTIDNNGTIHLLFNRYQANNRSLGMYYVYSENEGTEWSEADVVSEGSISFSDIQTGGDGTVHALWQENGNTFSIWHAYFDKLDERWENRRAVQSSLSQPRLSPLMEDANGVIHLLQLTSEGQNEIALKHWEWNEPQWNVSELYQIRVNTDKNADDLLGVISPNGQMVAVYTLPFFDERANLQSISLFTVSRALDLNAAASEVMPAEEEVAEPALPIIETATPDIEAVRPTAETAMIVDEYRPEIDAAPVERPSEWTGLAIGVVGGMFMTMFILVFAVRSVRRRGMS
jgi:hypothetical protein